MKSGTKYFLLLAFFSTTAFASEPAQYSFETSFRAFGFASTLNQPATLTGDFRIEQNPWETAVTDLNVNFEFLPESKMRYFSWSPKLERVQVTGLRSMESNIWKYGFLETQGDNSTVAVELYSVAPIDPKIKLQTENTALESLPSKVTLTITFFCKSLPSKIGETVECKLGRSAGLERPGHSNPILRTMHMEPLNCTLHECNATSVRVKKL